MITRRAKHAGTWYSNSAQDLNKQLECWLDDVDVYHGPARAIIVPHAGYQYSGACGAFSYQQINPELVKRIFILGPSHHSRIDGCALSGAQRCQTPLYDLIVDEEVNGQLFQSGQFTWLSQDTDENEHSIELQLPYLAKVMEKRRGDFTVVPIMVGSMSPDRERQYGHLLAPFLSDPHNLFVISSDFCHWGSCFRYTYYDKTAGAVHQSIERIDRMALDIIESMNPSEFTDYFKKYNNTICGRHPISVFLQMLRRCLDTAQIASARVKCLHYTQSNRCRSMADNSVSYAAASLVIG